MCFSAEASFTAAAALTVVGILSLRQAKTPAWRWFAATPLLFGVQQAAEGIVWTTLNQGTSNLHLGAMYFFYFFASIFWPVFVPLVVHGVEPKPERRRILRALSTLGIIYALPMAFLLCKYGTTVHEVNHHLEYATPLLSLLQPTTSVYAGAAALLVYCLVTIGAMLVSSIPMMKLISLSIILGTLAAWKFFWLTFGSVWCFFAAIASLLIYLVVIKQKSR